MSETNLLGSRELIEALATMRRELHPVVSGQVVAITREAMFAARRLAPVRTGTLVNSIQMTLFDEGMTGVVFVAPRDDPGYSGGRGQTNDGWSKAYTRKRAANFPLWVEYGTRYWPNGRPFLMPTFRSLLGKFSSACASAARRLVEGSSSG